MFLRVRVGYTKDCLEKLIDVFENDINYTRFNINKIKNIPNKYK